MTDSAYRYVGDKRLSLLKRLFRQWHHQLVEFEDRLWDDLPYWYSERTNIGILAVAALRLKTVVPLEEYPIRRGNKPGRADLGLYDERSQRSYNFEFKFCYSALGWSSTKTIKAAMTAAGRDIRSLPKPPAGSQNVAITFVVPYSKHIPPLAEWNYLWKEFLLSIAEPSQFNADFVAVHRASDDVVRRAAKELGFHPGVAAFGRVVHRR